MRIPLLTRIVVFFFCACKQPTMPEGECRGSIYAADEQIRLMGQIKSGDVILRMGKDELSAFFNQFNKRNPAFSHCGIAWCTDTGIYVYHIIATDENWEGKIVFEPLSSFIHSSNQSSWGVVRYNNKSIQQMDDYIQASIKNGVSFDRQFDLATNQQQYCSEMVYRCLLYAGVDSTSIPIDSSQKGKKYVAVDALMENKSAQTIGQITYK